MSELLPEPGAALTGARRGDETFITRNPLDKSNLQYLSDIITDFRLSVLPVVLL